MRDQAKREPVCIEAELAHQLDVFAVPVVVVAGHIPGVAVQHPAALGAERIPRGAAPAALIHGPLDLVGGGRRTPDERFRKGGTHAFRLRQRAAAHIAHTGGMAVRSGTLEQTGGCDAAANLDSDTGDDTDGETGDTGDTGADIRIIDELPERSH